MLINPRETFIFCGVCIMLFGVLRERITLISNFLAYMGYFYDICKNIPHITDLEN